MGFQLRKSFKLGPFKFNFTERGYSSTTTKVGRYSHNSKTGRSTFDTPGPGSFKWGGKPKGQGPATRRNARAAQR